MKTRFLYALAIVLLPAVLTSPVVRAAAVPGTSCTVFPADNIWNTDISQLPVSSSSNTWISHTMPSSGLTHPDFGRPPYGMPFNVASNSDTFKSFNFLYASESDPGPYPIPASPKIEAPSDSHMLVINKDTCKLYETFATDLSTNPPSAGSGAIFDLTSDALRPAGWTSADAAGLPIFPGLVRFDEVQAGFIGHAIRFTVHNTNDTCRWPAAAPPPPSSSVSPTAPRTPSRSPPETWSVPGRRRRPPTRSCPTAGWSHRAHRRRPAAVRRSPRSHRNRLHRGSSGCSRAPGWRARPGPSARRAPGTGAALPTSRRTCAQSPP